MGYYTGKDHSDDFIDPDYERLRRDKNILLLQLDALNKKNTKLNLEIAQNKLKNITLDRLISAIDRQYEECEDEFIKYLHDVAHHFDNYEENYDDYSDETTDMLQKLDENDGILREKCEK